MLAIENDKKQMILKEREIAGEVQKNYFQLIKI